jgi:hypothetical protein
MDAMHEICVIELGTVMHNDANLSNGRPGNYLKYKARSDPKRD